MNVTTRWVLRPATYLGALAAVFGLSKLHAVANGYDFTASSRLGWAIGFVLALWLAAYAFGLPAAPVADRPLVAAFGAATAGVGAISVVQLFVGDALLPRAVVFGSGAALAAWWWALARLSRAAPARPTDRVLLVGDLADEESVRAELAEGAERRATIAGVVTVDALRVAEPGERPLVTELGLLQANVVVLSREAQGDDSVVDQAALLHERGIRVRTMIEFYEEWLGKMPLGELERVSLMFDIGEVHQAGYPRVKRLLDVVAGFLGAIVLLAVTPFVVVGDVVANRGPLLFRQPRVGRGGRPFTILKFRTMRDVDHAGEWTAEGDARVTPFGRVLRRTHLDELPQVLNVLRGDLSVVGPRPEQPRHVERLRAKLPFYDLRHLVRPGLTGWAQVKYRYASSDDDALDKLQYEFWYLRHQSLGLDVRIVGRTLRHVVGLEGR